MVTGKRKPGFVEAIAPRPKTQTEWKRRIRSLSHSDSALAVAWLNAARGKPAYRRVLAIRQELEEIGKALDCLRKTRRDAPKLRRGQTGDEILRTSNELMAVGQMQEQFRERHNALNQRLARYTHVPGLAYSLDSGAWRFGMVPKHRRGPEIVIEDQSVSVRVDESTVVAALCRLAASRELHKVRLCEQCGEQWRVSERKIDRFCSPQCREAFYAKSPEFRQRKATNQRNYRDRMKENYARGFLEN